MKINITQQDIDEGLPGQVHKCPIAQALCRIIGMVPDAGLIEVEDTSIVIFAGAHSLIWELDDTGIEFVEDFDHGMPVQPCTIEATCSV